MGITSTPSEGSKSPSVSVSPIKTGSGGAIRKPSLFLPYKLDQNQEKYLKPMKMLLKNYFFKENVQSFLERKIY